ncbi:MAG TPA: hypothetical protein PLT25_10080 [Acidocella sp.]|nr:MAG: glycosyl transferase family 8 [Acidocella sp. 21-58-7]HQT65266.1 hypothetical protein [Acidocella sp.]HQU05050.1 hypothetical protein [Acidocella sp.]
MNLEAIQVQAHNLIVTDKPEEAEALLRPYLANGVGPIPLWRQLAVALRRQGKIGEVRQIQLMLVEHNPGDLTARFDLSETLLLLGEFDRGWREYQYRYSLAHTVAIERKVQRPRWGGEAIPGKTLLIHDEQGFGDTFQFIRLTREAARRSQARVIVEVNQETLGLARRSLPEFAVTGRGTLPPTFDIHCEMMSLPMALGLQLTDLPGPIPYLQPDPERLDHWRRRLAGLPRPLVTLAWAGRPVHPNDANRSITLDMLAPLAHTGAHFLPIQKGPAAAQANNTPPGMSMMSLSDEIRDFDDTAAIFCLTDLLISVDSSPTHLAGALGRPAWVMLPFVPDWRWLINRNDTPWYPHHRLFRQTQRGDWPTIINHMADALRQFVQAGRGVS